MIDPVEFGKQMAAIVREATAPLLQRIDHLEKALADRPCADDLVAAIDVEAVAKAAAALIPAPKDGLDADMDAIKNHIDEQVKALPAPKDGKSVTLDDIRPIIDQELDRLRKSADEYFADELKRVEDARDLLLAKAAEIRQPKDGQSVTIDDVAPLIRDEVQKAVAQIPTPQDGQSVTVDDVKPVLAELVDSAVKVLPSPRNGMDGKDADMAELKLHLADLVKHVQLPSPPSVDEVAAVFERRFSDLTLSWERQARDTFERAVDRMPTPKDGRDGRDALPLDSFDLILGEDGRTVAVKMQAGDAVIEKSLRIAAVLDRGQFKDGEKYEKGDGASHGGCFWIAQKDSPEGIPGMGKSDWRLAVKKGRDGKDLRDNASTADPAKGVTIR